MKIMLEPDAYMPTRVHNTDAGLDLYSREDKFISAVFSGGEIFDTGVHIAFDSGTYGKIESKSGLNVKHSVVSCGGVIDEGYTGSIKVKLYNFGSDGYQVYKGDKIAQLIIQPYLTPEIESVTELEETDRGDNGFGSTGR